MAYQVLLVDDELPALRFMQSMLEKYAPDFSLQSACTSGEKAFDYLKNHTLDVLVTDITMQQMNGIELAKQARKLQPDLHIVIISGYAEFEYAQGAIHAAVDDYILKPVSVTQIKQTFGKLKALLEEEHTERATALLPAIACGHPFDKEAFSRYFTQQEYRFALLRWGGIDPRLHTTLRATSMILPIKDGFYALRGRDDEEQLLIIPNDGLERFLSEISVYMTQRSGLSTWTVVYQSTAYPMVMLCSFLKQALPYLQGRSVTGKHQILPLAMQAHAAAAPTISPSELNQLSYFCSSGKYPNIKEAFINIAARMENGVQPQQQVWNLVRQLVLNLSAFQPSIKNEYERTIHCIADLFPYASSYGELFASIYSVLFDDESGARDRRLSTRELYDFAVQYVNENYARALSVQSVCDELGISQTYLSRLFRKYSDTTFNNCLLRRRMEAAMALLRDKPDLLLRDVAACVGYEDSSYFSKVFHQYTGQTPSQYASEQK